jgi:hypothetical protein
VPRGALAATYHDSARSVASSSEGGPKDNVPLKTHGAAHGTRNREESLEPAVTV